jgi:hypothetical protein
LRAVALIARLLENRLDVADEIDRRRTILWEGSDCHYSREHNQKGRPSST